MANKIIRGVNLGGWLVLERWMTSSLFEGSDAVDEYTFCKQKGTAWQTALRKHRDTFITEKDFKWLAAHGITAVRLPVGHWAFGDETPYQATIEYVDKVFAWAEKHGIRVLLSVHGVPGSQNGQDHSGRSGDIAWHADPAHHEHTLTFLRRVAERYKDASALYGIELMNEPSRQVPKRLLKQYYRTAYKIVRETCGRDCRVIFSDGYQPRRWPFVLPRLFYWRTVIDTHRYNNYTDKDKQRTANQHVFRIAAYMPLKLRLMRLTHSVLVGEWSAALDENSLRNVKPTARDETYTAYVAAQLLVYETSTAGWFYWSYKTETGAPWDYRDCVRRGWLPDFAKDSTSDSENA